MRRFFFSPAMTTNHTQTAAPDGQPKERRPEPGTTRLSGKRVVIVGAGPAGLTAAYRLLRADRSIRVTVLEESGCVGGISSTTPRG